MKKQLFYILTVFVIGMLLNACDSCDPYEVTCPFTYSCVDGCNCVCCKGIEGDSCNVLSRTKFIYHNYEVYENCVSSGPNRTGYNAYIRAGSALYEIEIYNFANQNTPIKAEVNGNEIGITRQPLTSGEVLQGYGYYRPASNSIELTVEYKIGSYNYSCERVIYSKRP